MPEEDRRAVFLGDEKPAGGQQREGAALRHQPRLLAFGPWAPAGRAEGCFSTRLHYPASPLACLPDAGGGWTAALAPCAVFLLFCVFILVGNGKWLWVRHCSKDAISVPKCLLLEVTVFGGEKGTFWKKERVPLN